MNVTDHAHTPGGRIADVLGRLDKVKRSGKGYVARCPAHEDRNPSLSIAEGFDGRVLLHCHAGCQVPDIAKAIGMDTRDLFPDAAPIDEWKPMQATDFYDYRDANRELSFQVVREEGNGRKTFKQRRPDGRGGWLSGRGDLPPILFRLPEVLDAVQAGHTIYVCEGEKDVLSLERAGVTATCNPQGAGKWYDLHTDALRGAHNVVIVADNDDPGLKHARQVLAAVEPIVKRAQIVLAATGKDATDHLRAGHTLDQFVPLLPGPAAEAPIVIETWREFADKASETLPCLVEGLWPEAALGFIASPPKKGKTWIGLSLALSLALGKSYLGDFQVSQPRTVLYVALEGHRTALLHRIGCLARGLDHNPDHDIERLRFAYKPRGINIADPEWAQAILNTAQDIDAALVVVDVLRAAARIKENDASEFADMRANLDPILTEGISIALLHHFTKLTETSKERTPAERMSGSGAMYGAMDIGVFITGSDEGARKLRLDFDGRDIATPDTTGVYLEGEGTGPNGGFTYRDTAFWRPTDDTPLEAGTKASVAEILAYIEGRNEAVTSTEIMDQFGISDDTLTRRDKELRKHGVTIFGGHGVRKTYSKTTL